MTVLGGGRYGTDAAGYRAMLAKARQWPQRMWAIEGRQGIGQHLASWLLADGEQVAGVPPKLSARARVFATGQGRKTDVTGAHSVARVATRMQGCARSPGTPSSRSCGSWWIAAGRWARTTRMISQLHRLLLEPIPGGAKTSLSAAQAKALLARVRPRCRRQGTPAGRLVERHGADRRLLRRPGPPPPVPGGQPPDQPRAAHHGCCPAPHPPEGRASYDRKVAAGKTPMEAMRARTSQPGDPFPASFPPPRPAPARGRRQAHLA
jgi:hypothetical protein